MVLPNLPALSRSNELVAEDLESAVDDGSSNRGSEMGPLDGIGSRG